MHPYTFKRFDSYLEIYRKPGATSIDINFQMRTFEPNGILFYTNLSEPRFLMVGINDVPDQDFLRVIIIEKRKDEILFFFSFFLMKDS
jgi:hypothetical protein